MMTRELTIGTDLASQKWVNVVAVITVITVANYK